MIRTTLITLRDYCELKARTMITEKIDQKARNHYRALLNEILCYLGDLRLSEITRDLLNNYFFKIRYEATTRIQQKKAILTSIFEHAVKDRIVADNPVLKTKIIRTLYNPVYQLSDDCMRRLMQFKDDSIICDLLKAQLYSGLTRAEILGLDKNDPDKNTGKISIQRFCVSTLNERYEIRSQYKSKKARSILIPQKGMEAILKAADKAAHIRESLPETHSSEPPLIFISKSGRLLFRNEIDSYYKAAGIECGIGNLTSTMLESNFGLRAAGLGVNPKDLQIYLGYHTGFTVAKYYDYIGNELIAPAVTAENYYRRIQEE